MVKVSVIVPVYNVEEYIERCARSLLKQTLDELEYIFINDCSSDNSISVLNSTIEEYPDKKRQVCIINQDVNLGPSAARNKGLLMASGQYVIFCDSDDYVDSVAYESMYLKAIEHNANVVACGIQAEMSDDPMKCWTLLFNCNELHWEDFLSDYNKLEGGIFSSMCNKLIKREFLLEHNIFFDEKTRMWEDLYMTLRLRYFAQKMLIVDSPHYHYCLHPGSIVHSDHMSIIKSQVAVVRLIEAFFIKHERDKEYKLMIAFLKIASKELMFGTDNEQWRSIFPEATKYIYRLRRYYGVVKTMKYLLIGYGRGVGNLLFRMASKLKHI